MSSTRNYTDPCGVARGLDAIGERWALLVVRELLVGPKRFADLRTGLPTVSPNVLSQRLRDLEERGIVRRTTLGAPARVQVYELTTWGRDLEPLLLHLGRWGARAPLPEGRNTLSAASILLSLKAAFDASMASAGTSFQFIIDGEPYALTATIDGIDIHQGMADNPAATANTGTEALSGIILGDHSSEGAARYGAVTLSGSKPAVRGLAKLLSAVSQAAKAS